MKRVWLTTLDNPYNPFTQFNQWFAFDTEKGYNTHQYVARLAQTSDELSEEVNQQLIEQAVDRIVDLNVLGNYKKVESDEDFEFSENPDFL